MCDRTEVWESTKMFHMILYANAPITSPIIISAY